MDTWQLFPVREKIGRMWFHRWGKWEFQRGQSHPIRNSGQECGLPCSFHVIAKHRVCVYVCVGGWWYVWSATSIFPLHRLTPPPCSLPRKLVALVQNWHFPLIFQNYFDLEHAGKLANCVSIKLLFLSLSGWKPFSLSHSHFYSQAVTSLVYGYICRDLSTDVHSSSDY